MTAAAPNNTLNAPSPNNQESTMAAFASQPAYPLPPGARAIMQARSAIQGNGGRPLYTDPNQLDPSRFAPLASRLRGSYAGASGPGGLASLGIDYGAPAPGGAPQNMDASSATDTGNAAMRNLQADPGASDVGTFGQAEQDYGPTVQTAPGGVMDGVDLTTPDGWRNRFTMEGMRGARPAQPPRRMIGARMDYTRR